MKSSYILIKILIYLIFLMNTTAAYSKINNVNLKHTVGHTKKNQPHPRINIPSNIWERIREGMQIPQPTAPVDSTSTGAVTPATKNCIPMPQPQIVAKPPLHQNRIVEPDHLAAPAPKYTQLGLMKLHPNKVPTVPTPEEKYTKLGLLKLHPDRTSNTSNKCNPQFNGFERQACKPQPLNPTSTSQNTAEIPTNTSVAVRPPTVMEQNPTEYTATPCNNPPTQNSQALEPSIQINAQQQKQIAIYERVQKNIALYTQKTDYLQQITSNAKPYLFFIVENLKQYKLPYELALLPIIESGYQPTAISLKNAAGLWQFMPTTGLDFNLKQSEQYDDRLDIEASTKAAMQYLSFLKTHYNGDWLLALAAYNCGLGVVDDAINRNLLAGLETDFWSLNLPAETQDYVPRFLALARIFAQPEHYQFKPHRINNEPFFINVTIERNIDIKNLNHKDLKMLAKLAEIDYQQFSLLNPGFLQTSLNLDKPLHLLMPAANAVYLHQKLNMMAKIAENAEKTALPFSMVTQILSGAKTLNYTFPYLTLNP